MTKKNLILPVLGLCLVACGVSNGPSSNESNLSNTPTSETPSKELTEKNLFLVGDSTVSSFNDAYYYPRYGYGTQIGNYFDSKLKVNNLALSGRSSKSFLSESNYETFKSSIKEGDYLIIGFGHNDEKDDDALRFTNPTGGVDDETSFKHYLYNYYVKVALDKKATPILCTPIVRVDTNNNYSGASAHITSLGNYANTIIELGQEFNVTTIDLTALTKTLYSSLGYSEAINYHAWTTDDPSSVDKTHLNIFGAKNVAYMIANEIKNSTLELKDYVLEGITAPTKENDLVSNPNYVKVDYTPFNKDTYVPEAPFSSITTDGWYGTAFGDTGGNPTSSSNGYFVKETSENIFELGQNAATSKGKISSSSDGFAMLFRQVDLSKNFELSCDIKVLTTTDSKQQGFGLMLRDDIYVNQSSQNSTIKSNYVASGVYASDDTTTQILFSRENTKLNKDGSSISVLYAVDDVANAKIERLGQRITTTFIYKDVTYTKEYFDFDLTAIDKDNCYIGMFATRGTTIECTNVNFAITGDAIQA